MKFSTVPNLIDILKKLDIVQFQKFLSSSEIGHLFVVRTQKMEYALIIPREFPYELPELLVYNERLKINLPHIMQGIHNIHPICYVDKETALTDTNNPSGIIKAAIERATKVIEESATGQNRQDFLREFYHYWASLSHIRAISILSTKANVHIIWKGTFETSIETRYIIGKNQEEIKNFASKIGLSTDKVTFQEMLYLPLRRNENIAFYNKNWDFQHLKSFVKANLGYTNERHLKEHLAPKRRKNIPIYITFPSFDKKSHIHIGVEFKPNPYASKHPILDKKQFFKMKAISVDRHDIEYMTTRGGALTTISNKNICIIGCGALGSLIAIELVKTGVPSITLIDYDTFSKDNIYRHVLGYNSIGKPKTDALKEEIELKNPLSNIISIPEKFISAANENHFEQTEYDLIINATGSDNTGMMIEDYFFGKSKVNKNTPIIHTWIEPLGIGGHSLLVNNSVGGCLNCLYTHERTGLYNRASFVAPNQRISKSLAGCVGNFTPYSSLDAQKTSILTIELAISTLLNREKGNPLLSWKGNLSLFETNNFQASDRYHKMTEEELFQSRYDYVNTECLCTKKSS